MAIKIAGGQLLSPQREPTLTPKPASKRVAKKSTRPSSALSPKSPSSSGNKDQRVYQKMGSWTENYKSPYATTSSVQEDISPEEVPPAISLALCEPWIIDFEKELPTDMIFKEAIKCPKCNFRNRVRYNLIRHMRIHSSSASGQESVGSGDIHSPVSVT